MKRFFTLLLVIISCFTVNAQTTLAFQGFEATANDTWSFTESPAQFTPNSNGDFWGIGGSIGSISPSPATGGSNLWAIQDLNNPDGGSAAGGTLSFPAINTTGYANFTVSFDYNVSGFDNGDDIEAQVTVDGVAQPIEVVVDGFSNFSTPGWQTYSFSWTPAAGNISFEIFVSQNGDGDQGAIDNIMLSGNLSSGCAISDITVQNTGACDDNGTTGDNSDDFFLADVVVTFSNKPATGTLNLTGDITTPLSVAAGSTTSATTHTFASVQIPANGASGDLMAEFSDDATCSRTEANILPLVSPCSGSSDFLIFSEYIESGNQKYLEIHNPSLNTISLANYQILIYANGSLTPTTTVNLTGTDIAPGGYYVIEHNAATTPAGVVPDQPNAFLGYNGNDAITLVESGIVRDALGQIGALATGGSWANGGCDTEDFNLRKDAGLGIATADTDPTNTYDPSVHWQFCSSTIDYTNLGVGFVFPVELVSFQATLTYEGTDLYWLTASESDNDRFEVFRTQNGEETLIAILSGAGEASEINEYQVRDLHQFTGRITYTLHQIDYDGKRTIVGKREVLSEFDRVLNITVQPVPVIDQATISWYGENEGIAVIRLMGIAGELVSLETIDVVSGHNKVMISTAGIPAGFYFVSLQSEGGTRVKRFVKY